MFLHPKPHCKTQRIKKEPILSRIKACGGSRVSVSRNELSHKPKFYILAPLPAKAEQNTEPL